MKRIADISKLNISTQNILNVIRNYAPAEIQELLPKTITPENVMKVGDVLRGYPTVANFFLNQLINRVALVYVQSATFNNRFAFLKKGYLEFGETVEDIFVNIAQVRDFDPEKAAEREFARTLPDVRTQFHVINWRVQYPITIQDKDLYQAFLSMDAVTDFIGRIVQSVYTAEEYDEFLLVKYLLIKNVNKGNIVREHVDMTNISNAAVAFRAMSNNLEFMTTAYNQEHVMNPTPRSRQVIIMDAKFNAQYDVNVLAAAFNMDKATFTGQLVLIDSFKEFDNRRFDVIRKNSDQLELVTDAELAAMDGIVAIIADERWFQLYDNLINFREKEVASGNYRNYFLNVYKTISWSIFNNIVAFDSTPIVDIATITENVTQKNEFGEVGAIVLENSKAFSAAKAAVELPLGQVRHLQSEAATTAGVGVLPYGVYMVPAGTNTAAVIPEIEYGGKTYIADKAITNTLKVGDTLTYTLKPVTAAANCIPTAKAK